MSKPGQIDVATLAAEFTGAAVGDARLQARLQRIVTLAATDPAESFPEQMGSVADREALYRFLANDPDDPTHLPPRNHGRPRSSRRSRR